VKEEVTRGGHDPGAGRGIRTVSSIRLRVLYYKNSFSFHSFIMSK
jgi:hypothetical protein